MLLDVQMRGLNGFETARLIRSRQKSSRTPLIFLTAYESDQFPVDEAYALGAVDYLIKPLVPVILKAKVAGFVELFEKTEQIKLQASQLRLMERQLAEDALRQRDERFRAIIEKSWDAMTLVDEAGHRPIRQLLRQPDSRPRPGRVHRAQLPGTDASR